MLKHFGHLAGVKSRKDVVTAVEWTGVELETLVRRHAPALYRLAYARTGNREDAEDILQEVFLRLVRRNPVFRDEEHCRAWLLRVAVNCANSLHTLRKRRNELPLDESLETASEPGPEEGGVLEAVLALPKKYRIPVVLYYYEERSTAEIASALGKNEATVRTWLFRARGLLREMLGEEGNYERFS